MSGISRRLKWVAALLVVFLLIIATNLVDRQHFRRVKESVVTIYEDRLVVKDLIFEIKLLVEQKRLAILTGNEEFFASKNLQVNDSIDSLIERFYATQLTSEERDYLNALNDKTQNLATMEAGITTNESASNQEMLGALNEIENDLRVLSKIQLTEGKQQLLKATKSVNAMDFLTDLEVISLILITICMLVILLYKPKAGITSNQVTH